MRPSTTPLRASLLPLACLAAATPALASDDLGVTYVNDRSTDAVFRLEDLDHDGTYNGPGEVVNYYDTNVGTIPISSNTGIASDGAGVVYVCDSTTDVVLALEDTNQNGTCNDAGDHRLFFDGNAGGNASGIEMTSAQNLRVSPSGVVWVAVSNTSSGIDQILRLEDLTADGDANDAGEAVTWFEPLSGGSVGDTIVQDIALGGPGELFYLENGATGFTAKGVYRLFDADGSGTIDPVTEVSPFFLPPALANTPFHWGMTQAPDGAFYMADTFNELVWRFRDDDSSGAIDNGTEAVQWWNAPGSSLIWQLFAFEDGSIYCAESQSPDRVLRMVDADSSGTIDPLTEVAEVYDEGLSPVNIADPRGLCVTTEAEPGIAFCFGDGSGTGCPCGNTGGAGEGCANSSGSGAVLSATGKAVTSADTLVLQATGCPANKPGLFFQGLTQLDGGAGVLFGDGLRCAGSTVVRLQVVTTDPGGAAASSISISVRAGLVPGDLRTYQYWFRDPSSGPCLGGFNTTNGYQILWK